MRLYVATLLLALIACGCQRAEHTPDKRQAEPKAPVYKRPAVIDFHGHLSIFGVDRIRTVFEEHGVDKILNLSGGRTGGRRWLLSRVLSERFDGRVLNAMNVDWRGFGERDWAQREAGRLHKAVKEQGFVALKISKALGLSVRDASGQLVLPDDARIAPLWEAAAALQVPVCIHVGDPKAFWAPLDASNERIKELTVHPRWSNYGKAGVSSWEALLDASERLFRRHPRTTFVAVHFGNAAEDPKRVDRVMTELPNVWIDVSARVGEFGRHPAEHMRAFFIKHQDRILFGTDIGISDGYLMLGSNGEREPTMADVGPFYAAHFRYFETNDRGIAHPSPIQGDWTVDGVGLEPKVLNKIYRDNALRLLARVGQAPKAAQPRATSEPQAGGATP